MQQCLRRRRTNPEGTTVHLPHRFRRTLLLAGVATTLGGTPLLVAGVANGEARWTSQVRVAVHVRAAASFPQRRAGHAALSPTPTISISASSAEATASATAGSSESVSGSTSAAPQPAGEPSMSPQPSTTP
jgi:hypothetical protein